MAALERVVVTTNKFVLQELPEAFRTDEGVILVQAGRSGNIEPFTLMGKAAVTGKWIVPYAPAAVDGSAVTVGVYLGETILEATIKAGDVLDAPMLTAGARIDEDKLIVEGATTLATVVGATLEQRTVRDVLAKQDLYPQNTEQVMGTY